MELYDNPNAVCGQKVRLVLAEKGLDATLHWLDLRRGDQHSPDYLALNPAGVVPTLVDAGHVVLESSVICEYLDDRDPAPPLRPVRADNRATMRHWMKFVDNDVHPACGTLTWTIAVRPTMLRKPPEELRAHLDAVPDPARRERQRMALAEGFEAAAFRASLSTHRRLVSRLDDALRDMRYLADAEPSLADFAVLPYVTRLELLGLGTMWASHVAVRDWFDRMRSRPSFEAAIVAHYTPAALAAMAEAGRLAATAVQEAA